MSMKVLLKFLSCYCICICVCYSEGIPPVGRGAFKSSRSIQDLFSVNALCSVQLLAYNLKPMAHEISVFVPSLGCILMLGMMLVLLNLLY
jgi:hypothetical protein